MRNLKYFSALHQKANKSRFTSQLDNVPEKNLPEKYNPFKIIPSNINIGSSITKYYDGLNY